jgi:hypothetical protein
VTAGLRTEGAGGVSATCLSAIATAESPSNGSRPVSSSKSTIPIEYRSDCALTGRPWACSGERYCAVP